MRRRAAASRRAIASASRLRRAGCPRLPLRWVRRKSQRGVAARGERRVAAALSSALIRHDCHSSLFIFDPRSHGSRCLLEASCSRAAEVRLRAAPGESVHDGPTVAQNRGAVPGSPRGRAGASWIRSLEPHQSALLGHQHHAQRPASVERETKGTRCQRASKVQRGNAEDRSTSIRHSLRPDLPLRPPPLTTAQMCRRARTCSARRRP